MEKLSARALLTVLSRKQYQNHLVIPELIRQQKAMYEAKSHRVVTITAPYVRPCERKAKATVECGAKVAVNLVEGYTRIEHIQWETVNERLGSQAAMDAYREEVISMLTITGTSMSESNVQLYRDLPYRLTSLATRLRAFLPMNE